MKKLLFLLFLVAILSSCSNNIEDNGIPYKINESTELGNIQSGSDFVYVDKYDTFSDLVNDENGIFFYGVVTSIEGNNNYVDSVYFEVLSKNRNGETIRISVEKDSKFLEIEKYYVLHLNYTSTQDYYSLTSHTKSLFIVEGEVVYYPNEFVELGKESDNLQYFLDSYFLN